MRLCAVHPEPRARLIAGESFVASRPLSRQGSGMDRNKHDGTDGDSSGGFKASGRRTPGGSRSWTPRVSGRDPARPACGPGVLNLDRP